MDLFDDLPEPVADKKVDEKVISDVPTNGSLKRHSQDNGDKNELCSPPDPKVCRLSDAESSNNASCPAELRIYLRSYTSTRKGERPEMQDRHTAVDNFGALIPSPATGSKQRWWQQLAFFGVYDGHGGARASSLIAERLHANLAQELPRLPPPDTDRAVKRALLEAYKRTDEEFLRAASKQRPHWRDGSTAVTALMVDNVAYIAHVGDSKAVLCQRRRTSTTSATDGRELKDPGASGDGCPSEQWSAVTLTKDHSPQDYEERQRIQRSGAVVRDGRVDGVLEVSRSFGDYNFKKRGVTAVPDIRKCRLDADSRLIIIACDGLWHSVPPEEAARLAAETWHREGGGRFWLERASSRLASEAVRRLCGDNVTVMLVSCDTAPQDRQTA